jgi:phage baseplate assembly protein W
MNRPGPNNLSDKPFDNTIKITARNKPWADLDLSLKLHPIRKDIIPLKDDAAIRNSVRNLIITNFFERPFQPTLGANLLSLLFEPNSIFTRNALRNSIGRVLSFNEPRIQVLNIEIKDLSDTNKYDITISYLIKELNITDVARVSLERIR